MKAKYFYVALFGLSTLLGTTGCEDRLNIPKLTAIWEVRKTSTKRMQMPCRHSLLSTMLGEAIRYNWFFVKNLLADDVWTGGGGRGDNSEMERLNEYTFDIDHSMVSGIYSGMYGIIYNANLIIDLMEPDHK